MIEAYCCGLLMMVVGVFASCSESDIPEMPEHNLDVEFRYELTCSEMLLKYVTPQVTLTESDGSQRTIIIDNSMWEGTEHKTWKQSVHYDRLSVMNTATVRYVPKSGVVYQNETGFDQAHYLSCFISINEDGDGRRNKYTIIPDFPSKVDVSAAALQTFINNLSNSASTRGGSVDQRGEITKIETD